MKIKLSPRVERIIQSDIRTMSVECERVNGINLAQGVCDLETPEPVRSGARGAIDEGINQYTRYDGLSSLRQAIAEKMRNYNKVEADPEKNIIVSCGATGAFYSACLALLDSGDEVIVFEPYYEYHVNTIMAVGGCPVYAAMRPGDWSIDMRSLEKLVTARTRCIVINTPANPSGKVFSEDELCGIADLAVRHNLLIFTDEIYEYFVFDGLKHISPASLAGIRDRTITISGYSKVFSITGWRIGYCVCDERWARYIGYASDLVYVSAPAPLQAGVAKGIIELSDDYYKGLCASYMRKRDKICACLSKAGLTPFVPQGAYYALADISALEGASAREKAMNLLRNSGVACVPGSAFYHDGSGEDMARFCFAKDDDELDEACARLSRIGNGSRR